MEKTTVSQSQPIHTIEWRNFKYQHKNEHGEKFTITTGQTINIDEKTKGIIGMMSPSNLIKIFPVAKGKGVAPQPFIASIGAVLAMKYPQLKKLG